MFENVCIASTSDVGGLTIVSTATVARSIVADHTVLKSNVFCDICGKGFAEIIIGER